jgi:transaldolase
MNALNDLRVKLFADGADRANLLKLSEKPYIRGFTTNPTLMRKAGVTDYRAFARDILSIVRDRPISFEVFSDDFAEMERQALEIASWAGNVFVKIPVTDTSGVSSAPLVGRLVAQGVKVNVTAILTLNQVQEVSAVLSPAIPSFVSVFAGRIADTGVDPIPLMRDAVRVLAVQPAAELIWASPREVLNIFHAEQVGCHVITATDEVLRKLPLLGKDLLHYSRETVRMFRDDAVAAGYTL